MTEKLNIVDSPIEMDLAKDCHYIDECLCCGNIELDTVLDLGEQPLANSYLESKEQAEDVFPLGLNYCKNCTHLQLTHAVEPDRLFRDYMYVSGTTKTLKDYFDNFVGLTESYLGEENGKNVLDIACNDGTQLDSFKAKGYNTYGIDPAENLHAQSSRNHNVVLDYLTEEAISSFGVEFDTIIAQNVFAHNTYPKEFLEICKRHVKTNGFIFIQTSQADMVKYGQFDTVYHEHISFFNMHSMAALLDRVGLYLHDVQKTDIHGTSYVFVITKNPLRDNTEALLESEKRFTLRDIYRFADNAQDTIDDLKAQLAQVPEDYLIIGYGAAAKGMTVLNFGKIKFDYIVDDNYLKQDKFTPGTRIPIIRLTDVNPMMKNVAWVPMAWNFFKEIKERIEKERPADAPDIFIKLKFSTT